MHNNIKFKLGEEALHIPTGQIVTIVIVQTYINEKESPYYGVTTDPFSVAKFLSEDHKNMITGFTVIEKELLKISNLARILYEK